MVEACGRMTKLTKSSDESAHQTVTEFIKLQTPDETIQIGFTDQKVSGRAGLLTFASFLHWHRFGELLAGVLLRFKQRRRDYPTLRICLGVPGGDSGRGQKAHARRPLAPGRDAGAAPQIYLSAIARAQSSIDLYFQVM